MKAPAWLKKAYKDTGTRWLTAFLLIGGPVWSIASYIADPSIGAWTAWVGAWAFYLLICLPLFYLQRNNP